MTPTKPGLEPSKQRSREATLTRYARMDPGIFSMADVALFSPMSKVNRSAARSQPIEIAPWVYDGRKLEIVSPCTLGADDLSVLLAVCALCGLMGKSLDAAHSEAHRFAIVNGLESEGEIVKEEHIRLRTTVYRVLTEAGLTDAGDAFRRVTRSLKRMSTVQYIDLGSADGSDKTIKAGGQQNLLSMCADEATGKLQIVLNARFTAAILKIPYSRINLDESRSLRESARLLHVRLSAVIEKDRALHIGLDTLAGWIYPPCPAPSREQAAERRKYVRAGLAGIVKLPGWKCTASQKRGNVWIRRTSRNEQP